MDTPSRQHLSGATVGHHPALEGGGETIEIVLWAAFDQAAVKHPPDGCVATLASPESARAAIFMGLEKRGPHS